jgi:hypothetical protein
VRLEGLNKFLENHSIAPETTTLLIASDIIIGKSFKEG